MDIKESDWKVFRELRETALERYCQRVLEDVRRDLDKRSGSYHERYLELWDYCAIETRPSQSPSMIRADRKRLFSSRTSTPRIF
jgi:hypothetical protein